MQLLIFSYFAFSGGILLLLLLLAAVTTDAFTSTVPLSLSSSSSYSSSSSCGGKSTSSTNLFMIGWDNDNFMDSLGQGQDQQQEANDKYYEMSKFGRPEEQPWSSVNTQPPLPPPPPPPQYQQQQQQQQQQYQPQPPPIQPEASEPPLEHNLPPQLSEDGSTLLPNQDVTGATFTEDMRKEVKSFHNVPQEESSEGGERFRSLMNRAKETAVTQLAPEQIPPNSMELSIEEQARLFREIMAQRQQQYQQQSQPQQQFQQPNNPYGQPSVPTTDPYGQQQQQQQPPNPYAPQQQQAPNPYAQQAQPNPYGAPPTQQQQAQQAVPSSDPYSQQLSAAYAQQGQQHMPTSQPPQQAQPSSPYGAVQQQQPTNPYPAQQQQQQPSSPYVYPPPQQPQQPLRQPIYPQQQQHSNYLEAGVGFDGRKIGRNKDADVVANTSDAYMARLKRDSTTRNYARYAGDDTKANDVFHDPDIANIQAPINPYLEERRARERDMLETVPEEMLLFQEYGDDDGKERKNKPRMSSYKDKLAQFKAKRAGNSSGGDGQ